VKIWLVVLGIALAALHQDFWLWDNGDLLFGVIPMGLGYHALYSVVVALFWVLVISTAWPPGLDRDPEEENVRGEP